MDTVSLQDIQLLARQESARLHHYFVGVEHLFIALTQLKGGLTTAVLEHHGLSPRFVRYSIRESVGRYEERRFWPGFQETPRAVEVQNLARRYAGLHSPSERDLLLAILDEGDSVVIRVLNEMGADVTALRQMAANWTTPLRPRTPDVPIRSAFPLDAEQERVLQAMFRDYREVEIVRELADGKSGARVLLARPIKAGGLRDAAVVVKLHDRESILYERRRYDLHVKGTLPANTARLVDAPIVPDDCSLGGLKYTFVGRIDETEPVSLLDFALKREPREISQLINTLFEVFGPAWYLQNQPFRFGVWREYEHVLPPALVVQVVNEPQLSGNERVLAPLGAWSRTNTVLPGEVVVLRGFAVQKLDVERDVLHLAAGPQAEAVNRSGKVEVRGLGLEPQDSRYFRGDVVVEMVGRVESTRDDILMRQVRALEPPFDPRDVSIPSLIDQMGDLPNPLHRVTALLERQVNGHLSSIHGDLHPGNILVGLRGDAWLIDFFWARDGHTLFDWALLEVSFLVEVVAHFSPAGWAGAWSMVALLKDIHEGTQTFERPRHQAARLMSVIETIRDIVEQCLAVPGRWAEYYIAIALLALRCLGWKSLSVDARRLAFLVSALAVAEAQQAIGGDDLGWMTSSKTDLGMQGGQFNLSMLDKDDDPPTEQFRDRKKDSDLDD